MASAFLPCLIYSKSSCHKYPVAFSTSHISLNNTWVVFSESRVKEIMGESISSSER